MEKQLSYLKQLLYCTMMLLRNFLIMKKSVAFEWRASWWEGMQESYENFGRCMDMPQSTIPVRVYLSNQKKDIITQVVNAHLQFAEFSGCEKDADGAFLNCTLSKIEQWAEMVYLLAKSFAQPGVQCNNFADSIVIIDSVDGLYAKDWAKSADKEILVIWVKIHLLKVKTLEEVYEEMKIQVTGKFAVNTFRTVNCHCISVILQYVCLFSSVSMAYCMDKVSRT